MVSVALVALVLVGGLGLVLYSAWRRLDQLRVGGIDVALRRGPNWQLGVGRYFGDQFSWYRVLSLRSSPQRILHRREIEIISRRPPHSSEAPVLFHGMSSGSLGSVTVLSLALLSEEGVQADLEVAMGPDALTGFLSWLESAPPGIPWVA